MTKELLEYILFRLPIYDIWECGVANLESIGKEFNIEWHPEATQEEIAEIILEKFA